MTTLSRLRVAWAGAPVTGPGVSTFYTAGDGAALSSALVAFYTAIKSSFPAQLHWEIAHSGETIDDNTGNLTGAWGSGAPTVVNGTGVNEHAQGVGTRVVWVTNGVTGSRRVRGSTYLVPLCNNQYDTTGDIISGAVTAFTTAATAVVTALGEDLVILSRKTPAHSGASHGVVSAHCSTHVSWLRSRRT
jgi:hypothetical protein